LFGSDLLKSTAAGSIAAAAGALRPAVVTRRRCVHTWRRQL